MLTEKIVLHLLGDVQERTLARLEKLGFISRIPNQRPKAYRYEDVLRMLEALSKREGGPA